MNANAYFLLLQPSYWCNRQDSDMYISGETSVPASKFEKPPSNLSVGINIKDLRKVFQTLANKRYELCIVLHMHVTYEHSYHCSSEQG